MAGSWTQPHQPGSARRGHAEPSAPPTSVRQRFAGPPKCRASSGRRTGLQARLAVHRATHECRRLIRIGEAYEQIRKHGKGRVLAHATSGHCLQQNLVCVLEGN